MSRYYNGMMVRTSYCTGPYEITGVIGGCTCPSFLDSLEYGFHCFVKVCFAQRPQARSRPKLSVRDRSSLMVIADDCNLQVIGMIVHSGLQAIC